MKGHYAPLKWIGQHMGLNFRKFQAERPERGEVFTVFVNSHLSDDCLKLGKIVELHFYRKVSKKKMPENGFKNCFNRQSGRKLLGSCCWNSVDLLRGRSIEDTARWFSDNVHLPWTILVDLVAIAWIVLSFPPTLIESFSSENVD